MKTSESLEKLADALSQAQGEFEAVEKSAANPFFKSKYADLASIIEATAPVLSKHGLSVVQMVSWDGEHDLLTTRLMHKDGEWMESTMRLFLVKADPQGQGSAVTYARRYQLQSLLNLRSVDDDGNAASTNPGQTQTRQSPTRAPANESTTEVPLASQAQLGMLNGLFEQKGYANDREVRLRYCQSVIARQIESSKDLTKREASKIIDSLQSLPDEG